MSNGNYQETHERILKSGLAAFLEEGFEKANLRRICKAAGVTTGAFYKHFKDKEALFSELVEPLASMIRKAYAQGEKRGFAGYDEGKPVTPEQVRAALEAKAAGTLATTAMLYSHRDIYELLVFRSYGTPYEHFLDWLVDEEDRTTLRVLELIHGAEKARTVISKESLHIVNHAFYSALSENIIHVKTQNGAPYEDLRGSLPERRPRSFQRSSMRAGRNIARFDGSFFFCVKDN